MGLQPPKMSPLPGGPFVPEKMDIIEKIGIGMVCAAFLALLGSFAWMLSIPDDVWQRYFRALGW